MKLISHYVKTQEALSPQINNWINHYINDRILYSDRRTDYDRTTYPSRLHYHDYYELVVFLEGDIQYICESQIFAPGHGDIVLIPPGNLHMSRLNRDATHYKRHVFYFYPDAFASICGSSLTQALTDTKEGLLLSVSDPGVRYELLGLLQKLTLTLEQSGQPLEQALSLGYLIQIFYLINQYDRQKKEPVESLPHQVLELQQYIDLHISEIASVTQVAEHFYYSREYVSRLFKKHLNTTVSDYIRKRRIVMSQTLIRQGLPLLEVCFQVGFEHPSTFIRAFRSVTGMTPLEYRQNTDV